MFIQYFKKLQANSVLSSWPFPYKIIPSLIFEKRWKNNKIKWVLRNYFISFYNMIYEQLLYAKNCDGQAR